MVELLVGVFAAFLCLATGWYLGGRYILSKVPLLEAAARQGLYEAKEAELKALNEVLNSLKNDTWNEVDVCPPHVYSMGDLKCVICGKD